MHKVHVTGCYGQVGVELGKRAPAGIALHGTDRDTLDITDAAAVAEALEGFDAVINAAAYTAVDKAESEPDLAFKINAEGPRVLAEHCAKRGIPLLHISTDYVFDGKKSGPWTEDDAPAPLSVYGASKAAGEEAVREACETHVILRTSWVYAAHGSNFVRTMLRLGADRDELRVVDDQIGAPTSAADIADALHTVSATLLEHKQLAYGTFHYTASGTTSWCGFADAIFEYAERRWRRRPRLTPIATSDYPTAAQRPANSVLDCRKIMRVFDPPRRPWQAALADVMDDLVADFEGTAST